MNLAFFFSLNKEKKYLIYIRDISVFELIFKLEIQFKAKDSALS